MKILLIVLLLGISLISTGYAQIFVIYDNNTKEIYSVAGKDDTLVPQGMTKAILPGDMETYQFAENPTNCKFIDNKFIVNTKKINDAYNAKLEADAKAQEEAMVQAEIRKQAIASLKAQGKELIHIDK